MVKERPSQEEIDFNKVDDAHAKAHIAGIVGVISLGTSLVFPAAIGGSIVGFSEALRQGKKMFSQMEEFDRKYPYVDKKNLHQSTSK